MSKIYKIDEKSYHFNKSAFNSLIKTESGKTKSTQISITNRISDDLGFPLSTIKNWKLGRNAPNSIDDVKDLASYFNVEVQHLLKEKKEIIMKQDYSIEQVQSVKKVYDPLLVLFKDILDTEGLHPTYGGTKLSDGIRLDLDKEESDCDGYNYLCRRIENISLILEQERIFLHDTHIYAFLENFIEKELYDFLYFLYYGDENVELEKRFLDDHDKKYKEEYIRLTTMLDNEITSLYKGGF